MKLLSACSPTELKRLRQISCVLTDLDDTLSTRGKLTPDAFAALWRLHHAGLKVMIVTGRPAGWCDHIARFWPLDAVVGENGAFYFHHDGSKLRKRFVYSLEDRSEFQWRLAEIRRRVLAEVPGAAIASDQPYRETDLAIDFCEDVPPLPRGEVLRIKSIFEEMGATAKISSIHVNGWFGNFDKLSTTKLCARELFGIELEQENGRFAFCGDSPNDEPMFEFFEHSFGVANIERFRDLMKSLPAYVSSEAFGAGFAEIADLILANREVKTDARDARLAE
jgi:HAD superfamily hydrolase (TIGR01484 family)